MIDPKQKKTLLELTKQITESTHKLIDQAEQGGLMTLEQAEEQRVKLDGDKRDV